MSTTFMMHPEHDNPDEWLHMSNGLTAMFLFVLALSGSRLAKDDKEKELIIWIIEHDDTVYGRGCNAFDISEMPWDVNNFEKERDFIFKVIEGAKEKLGWESIEDTFKPREDWVFSSLDTFYKLVKNFDKKYIDKEAYTEWKYFVPGFRLPDGYPDCREENRILGLRTLKKYDDLILEFEQLLDQEEYREWVKHQKFPHIIMPAGFKKCKKHGTFLYWHGCIICNYR